MALLTRKNKIKRSAGEWTFDILNTLLMLLLAFITLYPFWYVLVCSFSNPVSVDAGIIYWWPDAFNVNSYLEVFAISNFWSAYRNTIFLAVGGTVVSMFFTILTAYPLSKKRLWGRRGWTFIMIICMNFVAGMIPRYLIFRATGVMNNHIMFLFAFALTPMNIILVRAYFESVSDSLEESAKLDGAGDLTILFKIYIPLSVPVIMTVSLYYFVARWNSYFWEMILFTDDSKVPLQVVLKNLVVEQNAKEDLADEDGSMLKSKQTIIYATIICAALPMLVIYPFVQRFFVKGIMIGAVKG